jgi:hypothetical protein
MKWRVVLELVGADGTAAVHEVSGGATVAEYTPRMIGLTLAEGKHMLATVQRVLSRLKRRTIAAAGGAASGMACGGRSKICGPDDWCRCSGRWKSARRSLPHAGVR